MLWYDAVVKKVTPKTVEVFYPEDNETKRHNLLVSGITKKRPKPLRPKITWTRECGGK